LNNLKLVLDNLFLYFISGYKNKMDYSYDSDENIVHWKDLTMDAFEFFNIDYLTANVLNENAHNRFKIIYESLIQSESDEIMFMCALFNAYASVSEERQIANQLQKEFDKIQKKWKMKFQQGCSKQITPVLAQILAHKKQKQSKTRGINKQQLGKTKLVSGRSPVVQTTIKHFMDGGRLEGTTVNGIFEGPAIEYDPEGNWLEGTMVNDIFQGPAIRYYKDGGTLEGSMMENKFQGPAIECDNVGNRLEGIMVNNIFDGPAIQYNYDGSRLEGTMVNGKFQGPVTKHYKYGDRLEVSIINGKFQGKAIKYFSDGSRIQGTMVRGKFEGPAFEYTHDGRRIKGSFVNGKFKPLKIR